MINLYRACFPLTCLHRESGLQIMSELFLRTYTYMYMRTRTDLLSFRDSKDLESDRAITVLAFKGVLALLPSLCILNRFAVLITKRLS